jgi:hypothetical protein
MMTSMNSDHSKQNNPARFPEPQSAELPFPDWIEPGEDSIDADAELLTAYIDNELADNLRIDVQNRLADDPSFRRELQELQRTWDMLDVLPATPVDPNFTRSTLELVNADQLATATHKSITTEESGDAKTLRGLNIKWLLVVSSLSIFATFVAVVVATLMRYQSNAIQMRNLSVIHSLPGLIIVNNLDVAQAVSDIPEVGILKNEVYADRILPNLPSRLDNRRRWSEALSEEKQTILYRNYQNFLRLSDRELDRIKTLEREIDLRDNSDKLQDALSIIAAVLERRPPAERAAIRSLETEQQIIAIRDEVILDLGRAYRNHLTDDERMRLDDWIRLRVLPSRFRTEVPKDIEIAALYALNERRFDMVENGLLDELIREMSPVPKFLLSSLDPMDARDVLSTWYTTRDELVKMSVDQMAERYRSLSPEEKEQAEFLSRNQMYRYLRRRSRDSDE